MNPIDKNLQEFENAISVYAGIRIKLNADGTFTSSKYNGSIKPLQKLYNKGGYFRDMIEMFFKSINKQLPPMEM